MTLRVIHTKIHLKVKLMDRIYLVCLKTGLLKVCQRVLTVANMMKVWQAILFTSRKWRKVNRCHLLLVGKANHSFLWRDLQGQLDQIASLMSPVTQLETVLAQSKMNLLNNNHPIEYFCRILFRINYRCKKELVQGASDLKVQDSLLPMPAKLVLIKSIWAREDQQWALNIK